MYFEKKQKTGLYTQCPRANCDTLKILDRTVCSRHYEMLKKQLDKSGTCSFNDDKVVQQAQPMPQQQEAQPMPEIERKVRTPPPIIEPKVEVQPVEQAAAPEAPPSIEAIVQTAMTPDPTIPPVVKKKMKKKKEALDPRCITNIKEISVMPESPRIPTPTKAKGKEPAKAAEPKPKKAPKKVEPSEAEESVGSAPGPPPDLNSEDAERENNQDTTNLRRLLSQNRVLYIGFLAMSDSIEKLAKQYDVDITGTTMAYNAVPDARMLFENFIYEIMPELRDNAISHTLQFAIVWGAAAQNQYCINLDKKRLDDLGLNVDGPEVKNYAPAFDE
jgi:hypothetical protein